MKRSAPPPLNALRAFEAFARHGGMTPAAAELCVTHGAVSRQVRALQETMGVALVTGPRHRLVLTPAGRDLVKGLSPAFSAIDQAVARARQKQAREIEISCLGTFALKWLIPRLPGFVAAHPDIRVKLSESWAAVDFARDRFDGAIRILEPGATPERAEATPFLPQHQGPVVAPALLKEMSPERFDALTRLHAATFPESWRVWSDLTGVFLPPVSRVQEFAHNHSMIEAAVAGMGAAIAPWAFVAPDVAAGRLVAPFGFARRPSHFAFLRPAGRPNGQRDVAVDVFCDWLVAEGKLSPEPPPIPSTGPAD